MEKLDPLMIGMRFKILLGYLEEGSGDFAEKATSDLARDLELAMRALRSADNLVAARDEYEIYALRLQVLRKTEAAWRSCGPMYAAKVVRRALARWESEKPADPK